MLGHGTVGKQRPVASGGIEFEAILVAAVRHVKNLKHFLAFFDQATQPGWLKIKLAVAVLNPGRERAPFSKVVTSYTNRLVDSGRTHITPPIQRQKISAAPEQVFARQHRHSYASAQ